MLTVRTLCGVVGTCALSACVFMVEPVIPVAVAQFDPRLLGSWVAVDGTDRLVVTRAGAKGYAVAYTDTKGEVTRYTARLGRLGPHLVLDVQAVDSGVRTSTLDKRIPTPRHIVMMIAPASDSVRTKLLEPDSLKAALLNNAVRLRHAFPEGHDVVLTGSTEELRRGLGQYLARPGALDTGGVWRRVPAREHR